MQKMAVNPKTVTSDLTWRLARYAYFMGSPPGGSDADKAKWKFHDGDKEQLRMVVTSSHYLVVMVGGIIQESSPLVSARTTMKGVCKGDSLLLVSKVKAESRRFRVKFFGGETEGTRRCQEAVTCLRQHFTVRSLDEDEETQDVQKQEEVLQGDVSMATLAKVATGALQPTLPLVYKESPLPTDGLNTLIRLCLSDPSFPAFVGQVQKELNNIIEEEL